MSMPLAYLNQWDKLRQGFELLRKYQRDDGKIMHELTSAVEVLGRSNWEKQKYFYAAADSTSLYIIALRRCLDASGDLAFIKEMYPSITKAFTHMISTDYDGDGLMDNDDGTGWVEAGPLAEGQIAKGHTTFYLGAVYTKALQDMAYLAGVLKDQVQQEQASVLMDRLAEPWSSTGMPRASTITGNIRVAAMA